MKNANMEVIQSLPSLYPLKPFEEEAILNMANGMEPKEEVEGYGDRSELAYHCPCCNADLYDEQAFCKDCGCKIKWE